MFKKLLATTVLALCVSSAQAGVHVKVVNNDSDTFSVIDVDTQITSYMPYPTDVQSGSTSNFNTTSSYSGFDAVEVKYRSDANYSTCNFRYTTINNLPQTPIVSRTGSAKCSARITGFDFVTGDAWVTFTMDRYY